MKQLWTPWARFWAADKSLSVLLLLLVVVAFVMPPLTMGSADRIAWVDVLVSLLLLSGMGAVSSENRWAFRITAAITFGVVALQWILRLLPFGEWAILDAGSKTVALLAVAVVMLAKVMRPGTITRHRIEGAVAVYLLLGIAWAGAYRMVALCDPAAFAGAGTDNPSGPVWVYYSFVTLTTMGYGDVTPIHPAARSLAAAEALTGQLYLAILIARLVALESAGRGRSS